MPANDESEILDRNKVVLLPPEKWRQLTALAMSTGRSPKLKKLDQELTKSYTSLMQNTWSLAEAKELQKAMLEWQKSKGDGEEWKKRPRNKSRVIELLDIYINHALTHPNYQLNAKELGIAEVENEAEAVSIATDPMFTVRQVGQSLVEVRLKSAAKKKYDQRRRKYLDTVYERAKKRFTTYQRKITEADEKSDQFAKQLADLSGLAPGQISELLSSASGAIESARQSPLNPSIVLEKAGSVVDDFTGLVGKKAVTSFEEGFNHWYQAEVVSSARKYVAAGTPDAATATLQDYFNRAKWPHIQKGCIQTVSTVVKTVGIATFVSAEIVTAVGTLGTGIPIMVAEALVAAAINEAINQAEQYAIDYWVEGTATTAMLEKEVKNANRFLQSQNFDETMFIEAPIFGAYFLRAGSGMPTSAILGLGSPAFGTDVFQFFVEQAADKISELRNSAHIIINESPIEIVDRQSMTFIDEKALPAGSSFDQINAEIRLKINEKLIWLDKRQIAVLALAADTASSPQTSKPALQVWKQTLITRPNLEAVAQKTGVTEDLPYGSLLTTEDWKEFSSVGFFSKQKPRFLFSRRTKETKVLDDAFATFQQDYSNQMIETARVVTNKSAASGEDLPIARHKMDQRWKQLDTLLKQIDVWLKAKQKSGTSTRMASVVHLYHLVLIEQQTVASERDRLGDPSQNIGTRAAPFHAQNPLHQLNPAREFKPRSWDQASGTTRDGRGIWLRRET